MSACGARIAAPSGGGGAASLCARRADRCSRRGVASTRVAVSSRRSGRRASPILLRRLATPPAPGAFWGPPSSCRAPRPNAPRSSWSALAEPWPPALRTSACGARRRTRRAGSGARLSRRASAATAAATSTARSACRSKRLALRGRRRGAAEEREDRSTPRRDRALAAGATLLRPAPGRSPPSPTARSMPRVERPPAAGDRSRRGYARQKHGGAASAAGRCGGVRLRGARGAALSRAAVCAAASGASFTDRTERRRSPALQGTATR